jgi:hypothetical protein
MKSPHGQPSPALLRSIHRPRLRHNAGEQSATWRPNAQKIGGFRVFPAQPSQDCLIADNGASHYFLVVWLLDFPNI